MSSTGGGRFGEIFAQTRGPSLLEIMQAAGLTRAQRDARDMQREQLDRQFEQQTYERDAATREQMAQQRHQTQVDALALKKQQADQQAAIEKSTANEQRYYQNLMAAQPQNADRIAQAARERGINVGTVVTPQTMQQARATGVDIEDAMTPEQATMQLGAESSRILGPQKPDAGQQVPIDLAAQRVIRGSRGRPIPLNDPDFPAAYRAQLADDAAADLQRRKAGATSVNVGTGQAGLETPTKAKFEQDIAAADDVLARIDDVSRSIDSELVGWSGKAGEKTAAAIDYFGAPGEAVASALGMDVPAKMAFLERRQALKSQVRDVGDLVLRIRSGANAPEGEVKKLESIMGSIDDMGERQLRTALKTFAASMESMRNRKADAIAHGTRVGPPDRQPTDAEIDAKLGGQ